MKAKKYTNSSWAEGDYEKEYSTATDTYTTLPATFQTSKTDAVENYEVYGETVENLFDINTTWYKQNSNDTIEVSENEVTITANLYDYVKINVEANTDYTLSFEYQNIVGSMHRATITTQDITTIILRIDGTSGTFNTGNNTSINILFYAGGGSQGKTKYRNIMLTKGSTVPTRYVPYGTPDGVGEETENVYRFYGNGYYDDYMTFQPNAVDQCSYVIPVTDGDVYTISYNVPSVQSGMSERIYLLRSQKSIIVEEVGIITTTGHKSHSITMAEESDTVNYFCIVVPATATEVMLVKGSTAPTTFIPFGYKIPILCQSSERTLNLFNKDDFTAFADTRLVPANMWWYYESGCNRTTIRMLLDKNTTYSLKDYSGSNFTIFRVGFVSTTSVPSANQTVVGLSDTTYDIDASTHSLTFVTTNNTPIFLLVTIDDAHLNEIVNKLVIVEGSVLPQDYIGYYASSNYDLFLGDSKLYEDEYLDFGEQKMYKYVSGVLTPTDPPAPFPTISTYIGENNLSVDTTIQPEKVALTVAAWREIEGEKYQNEEWSDNNDT